MYCEKTMEPSGGKDRRVFPSGDEIWCSSSEVLVTDSMLARWLTHMDVMAFCNSGAPDADVWTQISKYLLDENFEKAFQTVWGRDSA